MELQTTASALFTGQMLPTKSNALNIGRSIASDCRNGFAELLPTVAKLKAIELAVNTALADLKQDIVSEIAKYGKNGTPVLSSVKLEPFEAGTKYDYAASGDPKWAKLKKAADAANAALKDREKFLRTLSKPLAETDMETGETFEMIPPPKSSESTYRVSFITQDDQDMAMVEGV